MKTSNTRAIQHISPYDQSRIDSAKQKSDSRVVLRAIADKAREESIKATAEYHKGLLDAEKSQMDLEKSRLETEKVQFDLEKANIDLIKANTYKAHLDVEKIKLENAQIQIEYNQTIAAVDLIRLKNEQTQINNQTLALTHEKDLLDKERLILNNAVAQIEAERVSTLQNIARAEADKAHAEADKARAEADKALAEAGKARAEADKALAEADKVSFEKHKADKARAEADKARAEADKAHAEADKAHAEADKARAEADKARAEADKVSFEKHKADKAHYDSIKSQADAEKIKLDIDQLILETQKYKDICETMRLQTIHATEIAINNEFETQKAHIQLEQSNANFEQSRLNAEKLQFEYVKTITELEQIRMENIRLNMIHAKIQLEIDKDLVVKETIQLDIERMRLATTNVLETTNVLALANTVKDNNAIINAPLELERIAIENSHVNKADKEQSISYKAKTDALMSIQRSKIIKTLQILSIHSCKRVDELYFNKSVTSITNIYQKTYNNNKCATGFGDFIRGCYFVLDFCEMFHFQPNIIINHPLNEFLENHSITNNYGIVDMVSMFEDNNWNKHILNHDNIIINTIRKQGTMSRFVNYLCSSHIDNNNINIYNILFPYFDVSPEHQQVMRDILKPSQEMKEYVAFTLKKFELTDNNYISVHIRSGDNYLHCANNQFNVTYLNHITNNIISLLNKHPNKCFLLIADNNFIKLYLSNKKIHRLYIIFNEIGHLGENTQLERNKVKNTMLDFYLFAHSSNIYSFSSYDHGSGFSFWCAQTYGIPYSCKIIKH